jgi:hypothetical protein
VDHDDQNPVCGTNLTIRPAYSVSVITKSPPLGSDRLVTKPVGPKELAGAADDRPGCGPPGLIVMQRLAEHDLPPSRQRPSRRETRRRRR